MSREFMGPGGWLGTVDGERRAFGEMGDAMPEMVCRHVAKRSLNDELLERTKLLQDENGIDDGFSFLHFCEAIFGNALPWKRQLIGSCVASGDMRTTSYRMLAEVFLLNDPEILPGIDIEGTDSFAPFAPFSYRAGRKRGNLNGRSDGSYCSVHMRGKMEDGILFCNSGVQSDTYPEPQNTSLYREWGGNDKLYNKWKAKAGEIKQLETEEVKNFDDVKELLTVHYKPMNICSSWGFAPSHKHPTWRLDNGDPVWIYKRSGSWAHNMSLIACLEVKGEWFIVVENSWGSTHKNGRWFVVTESTMNSWLRSASCLSVGEIDLKDQLPIFTGE